MTDKELLLHQLKNPPVMSMALNKDHLYQMMAERMQEAADRIEELSKERDQHWDSFVHWRKEADDRSEQLAAARQDAKEAEAYAEELEDKLSICERHRDAYAEMDRIGAQAVRDLEAKLAKAVKALEPFAKAAETWEPDDGDSGLGARIEHPHHGLERHAEFTFGDLRRARATLAEIKGGNDAKSNL